MTNETTPVRRPARGYSWPAFEKGHEAALTHGANSIRRLRPIVESLRPMVLEAAPWLTEAIYAGAVEEYLWDEARAMLLRRYLDEHGHLDGDGEERSAVRSYDRVQGRLAKHRAGLGLTPLALGKVLGLIGEVAAATGDEDGAEAVRAAAARILAARLAQAAEQIDGAEAS